MNKRERYTSYFSWWIENALGDGKSCLSLFCGCHRKVRKMMNPHDVTRALLLPKKICRMKYNIMFFSHLTHTKLLYDFENFHQFSCSHSNFHFNHFLPYFPYFCALCVISGMGGWQWVRLWGDKRERNVHKTHKHQWCRVTSCRLSRCCCNKNQWGLSPSYAAAPFAVWCWLFGVWHVVNLVQRKKFNFQLFLS